MLLAAGHSPSVPDGSQEANDHVDVINRRPTRWVRRVRRRSAALGTTTAGPTASSRRRRCVRAFAALTSAATAGSLRGLT